MLEGPSVESHITAYENHLNNFRKRLESANGEDQFDFLKNLTNIAFEKNNESRVNNGKQPLSKKEYVDSYIKGQESLIVDSKKVIENEKDKIKNIENRLNGENGGEVKRLKDILQVYLTAGGVDEESYKEIGDLIEYYEKKYNQDHLLDELSGVLKFIRLQEEQIQLSKDILNKINQFKQVVE